MSLPRNKYTALAALWFVLLWYFLLRESGTHAAPSFPHFDKAAHCAAFFAQFWLAARAWLQENRRPPLLPLAAAAITLAAASEPPRPCSPAAAAATRSTPSPTLPAQPPPCCWPAKFSAAATVKAV